MISGDLEFALAEPSPLIPLPEGRGKEGDVLEISPARVSFMKNLCDLLKQNTGAALSIDYGYTKPGLGETFQEVY